MRSCHFLSTYVRLGLVDVRLAHRQRVTSPGGGLLEHRLARSPSIAVATVKLRE